MLNDYDVKVYQYTFQNDKIYLILTEYSIDAYNNYTYQALCIGSEDNIRDDLVGETLYEIYEIYLEESDFKMSDSKLFNIYNQIYSSKLLNN